MTWPLPPALRRPRSAAAALLVLAAAACASGSPAVGVAPAPDTVVVVDTVRTGAGGEAALRQQVTQLQLQLLERDALLEELRTRLDEARREVVRAMAKLQSSASRAEAASAMAEAEVATRQVRAGGRGGTTDLGQAQRLLQQANAEFEQQNYGGALYLANEAKTVANAARRLAGASGELRAGEVLFAVPVRLRTTSRSNVREGPSTTYAVLFTIESGADLTGQSYVEQWIRVTDAGGRTGWIFNTLVESRR